MAEEKVEGLEGLDDFGDEKSIEVASVFEKVRTILLSSATAVP